MCMIVSTSCQFTLRCKSWKIVQNISNFCKFQTPMSFRNCELFSSFFSVPNLKNKFKKGISDPANKVDLLDQIRTQNRNYNAKGLSGVSETFLLSQNSTTC